MAATKASPFTIQGWHVLAAMLLFFGVIFAVNGVFLAAALRTHTGIVSKQPYRIGLDYNKRIAAGERQQALGWTEKLTFDAAAKTLRLELMDRSGRPVTGLIITGFIGRPSTEQHDIAVSLAETTQPGFYSARLGALSSGNWLVQLEAGELHSTTQETVYRIRERIWLKP
jgi:nitrogen fixation protein FixH